MIYFKVKLLIIHCLFPLIIGSLIYVLFRSTGLRIFYWLKLIGLNDLVFSVRNLFFPLKGYIPSWTCFSLPDGLWVYSFTSALVTLWNNNFQEFRFWLIIPIVFGIFVEILQLIRFFPGTFDINDLIFSILGLIISLIIINYNFKKYEK